jgi:hypothetical protein
MSYKLMAAILAMFSIATGLAVWRAELKVRTEKRKLQERLRKVSNNKYLQAFH